MPQGGSSDGQQSGSSDSQQPGTPPDGQQGGSSDSQQPGTPPDGQQGGSSDGQQPGNPPDGVSGGAMNGQQPGSASGPAFNGNGNGSSNETMTIKITSDTKVISNGETKSISDLQLDTMVTVTYDGDEAVTIQIQVMNQKGSSQDASLSQSQGDSVSLSGAYEVTSGSETKEGETIASEKSDENTVLVSSGASLTVNNCTLTKTGDSSNADQSNFYGLNAILATLANSETTIKNTTLTSASEGSNAIFSTGENSVVNVDQVTINTTGNSSRGLDSTYGGTITASNCKITTTGAHCAPVATDRGGGTVSIKDSTLNAAGDGSPCIYSTGVITADNVTGNATDSQSMVIEGKNSITLTNSNLTGAGKNGIMLYQSTSGDADEGTSELTVKKSTIKTTSDGPMFYITNTSAIINLENTKLDFSSGILLNAAGNSTNNWGTPGSNPGKVTLNATNQTLTGDITCDEISSVTVALKNKSTLTGTIDGDNQGDVSISLDSTSVLSLTKNSYVSVLTDDNAKLTNIKSNGYNLYYDSTQSQNSWLNGKTVSLNGGGKLIPMS